MSDFGRSAVYGGIYTKTQPHSDCSQCDVKINCKYYKFTAQLEKYQKILKIGWEKAKSLFLSIKDNLKIHLSRKQELYWPLLISAVLLLLVLVSKIAFAENIQSANNLPVEDNSKINLIGFEKKLDSEKTCSKDEKSKASAEKVAGASDEKKEDLKQDVAGIVKNTPMNAMVDAISEKPRPVAAFIVGIAMKESKFGIYSPKKNGRDCYNYWGFKGGGATVAGGYSCFSSPEQAVEKVGGKIESLVNRGVRNPAQMISWKCGSSCAGHGAENVRKWIADVGINFYKINS